jgi:SnoaL-like domain
MGEDAKSNSPSKETRQSYVRTETGVPMEEHEIQWAVDELEIRNVIASLALVSDMGEIEEWGMLFTEDADYTIGGRPFEKGRAAIVESGRQRRARGTHGPGSNNRHLSASVLVRSTGPDTAEAVSYLAMYKDLPPESEGHDPGNDGDVVRSPELLVLGTYRDSFRRTSDGWKVTHRDLAESSLTPRWRAIMKSWSK